jgi:hypothetical protein
VSRLRLRSRLLLPWGHPQNPTRRREPSQNLRRRLRVHRCRGTAARCWHLRRETSDMISELGRRYGHLAMKCCRTVLWYQSRYVERQCALRLIPRGCSLLRSNGGCCRCDGAGLLGCHCGLRCLGGWRHEKRPNDDNRKAQYTCQDQISILLVHCRPPVSKSSGAVEPL